MENLSHIDSNVTRQRRHIANITICTTSRNYSTFCSLCLWFMVCLNKQRSPRICIYDYDFKQNWHGHYFIISKCLRLYLVLWNLVSIHQYSNDNYRMYACPMPRTHTNVDQYAFIFYLPQIVPICQLTTRYDSLAVVPVYFCWDFFGFSLFHFVINSD